MVKRLFNRLLSAGSRNRLLAVVSTLVCLTLPAHATPPRVGALELGAFGGYTLLSNDNQLGNAPDRGMRPGSGPLFGARLSYQASEALALEAEVDDTLSSFGDSGLSASLLGWRGSALWHFSAGQLRPFALLGAGGTTTLWQEFGTEHDTDVTGHIGAGLKYDLSERIGVRADLRYFVLDGAEAKLAHNFAAHLGVWLRLDSPEPDADGDGLVDGRDKCPQLAEDKDGFEDADGCPDPDNDGDGLADVSDRCPNEAEDQDGFEDTDGCPDADNDRDGLADAVDKCPNEAEDKDGYEDGDGCPELDNDKDGLADAEDKCPKQSGKPEDQGCPPADRDEDGIADKLDKCPDKKETFNGKDDDDGCPDGVETVVVSKQDIKILQKVHFELGNAEIKAESYKLLDTVAAVLAQQQRLTKVAIEGHTDDLGEIEINQALSQRRAEAVASYLVEKGIASSRLVAEGFGSSKPLCADLVELLKNEGKNKKRIELCREQNRRVQFRAIEIDGKAVPSGEVAAPAVDKAAVPVKVPAPVK